MGLRHKDIGNYVVYSDGRVFSKRSGKFLIASISKKGYCIVKVPDRIKLHRLIASCFKKNKMGYPMVNHKDNNKQNNNIKNLEWCTNQQNIIHAYENGLIKNQIQGANHPWAKLTELDVHIIKEAFDSGFKGYRIAKYFKIHRGTAYKIRDQISWKGLKAA